MKDPGNKLKDDTNSAAAGYPVAKPAAGPTLTLSEARQGDGADLDAPVVALRVEAQKEGCLLPTRTSGEPGSFRGEVPAPLSSDDDRLSDVLASGFVRLDIHQKLMQSGFDMGYAVGMFELALEVARMVPALAVTVGNLAERLAVSNAELGRKKPS